MDPEIADDLEDEDTLRVVAVDVEDAVLGTIVPR